MRKIIEHTVLLLFLIPLFFINIKSSHGWGDDFAQYLHQAKNISEGISQNSTGYVFNPDVIIGPEAYPVGLPLLLAPIVSKYGLNFEVLNYFMTFFLVLSCLFGFIFLRKRFSVYTSFFTTLIIAYSPYYLNFKSEINSDIPFTAFLLVSFFLISQKKTILNSILLGLVIAFLSHIRSIGLLFIITYIITEFFINNSLKNASLKTHSQTLIMLCSFSVLYVILKFSIPCQVNYPTFFEFEGLFSRVNEHVSYNLLALSYFFDIYEPKPQYFIGIIGSSSIIVFSILGFFHEWKAHKFNFLNLFVLLYFGTIALIKFGDQGLRFISPLLFIIFYYAIIGLKKSLVAFDLNYKFVSIIFGLIMLFSYKPTIEKILNNQSSMLEGPCTDASFDAFNFIKSLQLTNEVIAFEKPRALALFTNTQSVALKNDLDLEQQIAQFKVHYILLNKQLVNDGLSHYAIKDTIQNKLIFSNSEYQLFKLH